jgi:hypothetical protein
MHPMPSLQAVLRPFAVYGGYTLHAVPCSLVDIVSKTMSIVVRWPLIFTYVTVCFRSLTIITRQGADDFSSLSSVTKESLKFSRRDEQINGNTRGEQRPSKIPNYLSPYLYINSRPQRGRKNVMKGKLTLGQALKSERAEQRCSSTLSLTSALDGVDGQRLSWTNLPAGKNPVPSV